MVWVVSFLLLFSADTRAVAEEAIQLERLEVTATLCPPSNKCLERASRAHQFCLEDRSPQLREILTIASLWSSTVRTLSTRDVCKKSGKVLKQITNLMTLYNTVCSAAAIGCLSSCSYAESYITKLMATLGPPSPEEAHCPDQLDDVRTDLLSCQKYKLNMAAAAFGIINLIREQRKANKCQDDLESGAADETQTAVGTENMQEALESAQGHGARPNLPSSTPIEPENQNQTSDQSLQPTESGTVIPNSEYANYLPGGARDPNRRPQAIEVTGPNGPSNWDKNNETFRRLEGSLIPDGP